MEIIWDVKQWLGGDSEAAEMALVIAVFKWFRAGLGMKKGVGYGLAEERQLNLKIMDHRSHNNKCCWFCITN